MEEAASGVIRFRAQELPFRYERGESGVALPSETTGGGVGMLDHDGDGDLDLFFAQGAPLGHDGKPLANRAEAFHDVLLRNDSGGRFTDVSKEAGLSSKGHGQGVTVADYDGDGDSDVYVTRYGPNTLWRNDGGHFTDVTEQAGVGCPLWSLGTAFADLDQDGDLDLFVANYFAFDPAKAPFLRDPATGAAMYGAPSEFPGLPDVLYLNRGDGTFEDATSEAGINDHGRGMGVLAADFDADGRMDLLVANDAEVNALWRNRGDGTFEDLAVRWGIALNGNGAPEANMGIAHGDTNADGLQDVLITHFYDEHDTLWLAGASGDGSRFFRDATLAAGLGTDGRPFTGWGTTLSDFDQDGRLDLVVTNGHIRPEPSQKYRYENPPILWQGQPRGRFKNVTRGAGPYFQALHMGRGLARGDLDGDLDLDLVIVDHPGPATLLWNESQPQGQALLLQLEGAGKNPGAIGAVVRVAASGREQVASVDGGGSYISSHAPGVHFGLGQAQTADRIEVRWPSGRIETREKVPAGQVLRWREGQAP